MILRIILFPFAILYDAITGIRNRLYDRGYKPSASFELPLICIGNLSVGGTGKTPMVEYLVRLLENNWRLATLSRGYKRSTRGFRIAEPSDTPQSIGDEPFQFYQKYGDKVTVAVGEERVFAIPAILQAREIDIILLDDAFQHRRVRPSFSILLTDYNRPFYNDFLLPAGRLRESRGGAERADVVVVTKCPDTVSGDELMEIEKSIRGYVSKPVFFSGIKYGTPLPWGTTDPGGISEEVILITGIANAGPLRDYVKRHFRLVDHIEYADHHQYTAADLENMADRLQSNPSASILTTEKDINKLGTLAVQSRFPTGKLFYLPIQVQFLKDGKDFDEMLLSHLSGFREKKL
jgi:tetraacyldisaccharide 4'-kinase